MSHLVYGSTMRANTLVTGQTLSQSNTARLVSMLVEHSIVRMLLPCVICRSAGVLLLHCYALCKHVSCKGAAWYAMCRRSHAAWFYMPAAQPICLQVSSEQCWPLKYVLTIIILFKELCVIGIDILPIEISTSCCYAGAYSCCSLPQGDL